MTAIALSPNRRYVAIGEKGEKPTVTIYDLLHDQSKKRKVFFYLHNTVQKSMHRHTVKNRYNYVIVSGVR